MANRPHVVNIVPAFIPGDGIGNAARARVGGLLNRGYQVTVICNIARWSKDEFPNLRVFETGAGWNTDRNSLSEEMRIAMCTADIVFLEFGSFSICHDLLSWTAANPVLFYQGITPASLMKNDMYDACYWRAIGELRKVPRPSYVAAASQFTLDEYRAITGNHESKSKVIPLFGNTKAKSGVGGNCDNRRRPFRVLTVGQLFPHKNYEVLIEASKVCVQQGLDIRVQHIGGADGLLASAYLRNLKEQAQPLGEVFEFCGRVDQRKLDEAYAEAHVVVIPSLHEGYSLPAREALLHGKPVIASNFGALPETLQGAATFFHPLDHFELASHIRRTATLEPDKWKQLCIQSSRIANDHSVDRYIDSCVELIEDVLASRKQQYVQRIAGSGDSETGSSLVGREGRPIYSHKEIEASDTRVTGCLEFDEDATLSPGQVFATAIVTSNRQIVATELPCQLMWNPEGDLTEVIYSLNLERFQHWSEIFIDFRDVKTGRRCWHLGGVKLSRRTDGNEITHNSHNRLRDAIESAFRPRAIDGIEPGIVNRIKAGIANQFLRLIYHVFVGPQVAAMQSILEDRERYVPPRREVEK